MNMARLVTKTRAEHAALISAALVKGVESVIEAGQRLAVAQGELTRPEFLAMLHEDLHITEGTASKLKSIASHPVLSQLSHGKVLPPNWSVLYALTQVPQGRLISAIKSGDIHPDMQRRDVKALLPSPKPEQRDDDLPPDYEGSAAPEIEKAEPEIEIAKPAEDVPTAEEISRFACKLIQLDIGLARDLRRIFQYGCERDLARDLDTRIGRPASTGNGADPGASAEIRKAQFAEDADRWIESDTR
jgi:hypothetical protein